MEFLAAGFSSLISVFALALFVAGVLKLFQIHSVLAEIRDALRMTPAARTAPPTLAPTAPTTPTPLHSMGTGDEMLRALDAQMKWDESGSRSTR